MVRNLELKNEESLDTLRERLRRTPEDAFEDADAQVGKIEADLIRGTMLKRLQESHGKISDRETAEWQQKINQHDEDTDINRQQLRVMKTELEALIRQSQIIAQNFDRIHHGAEEKGLLAHGEHDLLDERFLASTLQEKETMVVELEKELEGRQKEIQNLFKDLRTDVAKQYKPEIEKADTWEKKKERIEEARESNTLVNQYAKALDQYKDKISTKNYREFLSWIVEQTPEKQEKAIALLDEEMKPRLETWEAYQKLPKDKLPDRFRNKNFKEMGRRERVKFLGDLERNLERQWNKSLRDAEGVISRNSLKVFVREFQKGNDDQGERIGRKLNFAEMLDKQIDQEKRLWKQFDQMPEEIQDLFQKEFKEGDFFQRKELLETHMTKAAKTFESLKRDLMQALDGDKKTWDKFIEDFDDADNLTKKAAVVKEAKTFKKAKNEHVKLRKEKKHLFNSLPQKSEELFDKQINSIGEAKQATIDLKQEIRRREKVHNGVKKLRPKELQKRVNFKQSFEKVEKEFHKVNEVAKYYISTIPFMIQNAKTAEGKGENAQALNFYLQALKMDPDNENLTKVVASLKQKGVQPTIKPSGELDEEQTKRALEKVDNMYDLDAEAEELARKQLFLQLAKKNVEKTGATATTVEARKKAAMRSFSKEDKETAELVDGDFTVGDDKIIRKKVMLRADGTQLKETDDKINEMLDNKAHHSASETGFAEVGFIGKDGREMDLNVADSQLRQQQELRGQKRQKRYFGTLEKMGLSDQQLKAVQAAYLAEHSANDAIYDKVDKLRSA